MKNPIGFFLKKEAEPGYIANRDMFAFSAALAGQNMTYFFLSGWLFYFCNNILNISAKTVGYITSISRVWDSVNDPVVGALIDRHRFKSGEKLRPYHLSLPPVIGILTALMFINFKLPNAGAVVVICVLYFIWDILYSVQDVALWGMIAMSSPHSDERARLAQWTAIGVGAGAATLTFFPMLKGENILNALGVSESFIFAAAGIIFGLGGELISMSAYKLKEQVASEKTKDSVLDSIFVLKNNRTLLLISLARFLGEMTEAIIPSAYFFESSVSFNSGSLSIDGGTAQTLYTVIIAIPSTLAMFQATKMAKKFGGMKKTLIVAQLTPIVLRTVCYFIGYKTLPAFGIVMLLMSIVNIPYNLRDFAHRSLISDSIDFVEWKTGKRTEGISFSMQNFITKIRSAVVLYINGMVLHRLSYDNTIPMRQQNPVYMKWQWPLFMLGPVIGEILYIIVISFVHDNDDEKAAVEAELKERRDSAAKTLTETVNCD